jgi:very-short-patch-repair endonuclease
MPKSIEHIMFYGASPAIFEKARVLRESMTEAEIELWRILSNNKFMGLRFRAQHPLDRFIADFYCHSIKLVIEVDGGIHELPENRDYDINRTNELAKWDIEVIRFTNEQVLKEISILTKELIRICNERKALFNVSFKRFRKS